MTTHAPTRPTLADTTVGIDAILAGGLIDVMFGPDGPGRRVGIAHELLSDGTDREVAVVHAATYEQMQVELYEALVRAGHGAVTVS
jgi:hypothetical protein